MPYIVAVYDEAARAIESVLPVVYPDKKTAFLGAKSSGYFGDNKSPYTLKLTRVDFYPFAWGEYSIDNKSGGMILPENKEAAKNG